MLIAARFLQGVGGALASAVILGMIVTMFPRRASRRRRSPSSRSSARPARRSGCCSAACSPRCSTWHWIFFVNVPIGIAAFCWLRGCSSGTGLGLRAGADAPGAVLVTGALMLGVYTIVDAESWALGARRRRRCSRVRRAPGDGGAAAAAARALEVRDVAGANVVQMVARRGHARHVVPGRAVPAARARLRRVRDRRSRSCPISLAIGVLSLGFSARLIMRFGARIVLLPALALMAAGLWLLGQAAVDGGTGSTCCPRCC